MTGYSVIHFTELQSTNTYAKAHLAELADGTVIVADLQTAGRGQQGKTWESSNPENIYLSIVLKPQLPPNDLLVTGLSLAVGESLAKYVRELLPAVAISVKPPNDILVDGKKLCGILIETVVLGEHLKGIIIGIGLNIALTEAQRKAIDQPVTALSDYRPFSKKQILNDLISNLFDQYGVLNF